MDVDRHLHVRANGFAYERPDREVRNVMVVHYVKMDPIGAGGDDVADFFTEPGEIGREDAGGDTKLRHGA